MIKTVAKATGISWFNIVMALLMLAFILYIAGNGSLVKYRQMLF